MSKVLASGLSRVVLPFNEIRRTELNSPSKQVLQLPFYNLIPHDPIGCLRWKIYVRKRCRHDEEFRKQIINMCALDVCFFANTLCHVFEPRPPRNIPLTLWPDQADCLAWFRECIETERDGGCEKTRGIGMSWTLSVLLYHCWAFTPDAKIGVMTKDEATLDGPDANYLVGKFVYLHDHMPSWLRFDSAGRNRLKRTLSNHLCVNRVMGSAFQGFPPMESKVRGLRFTVFANDEYAYFPRDAQEAMNASVHTAPTRLFISTWHGANNSFHSIMRRETSTMLRIETYWWNNPERWKGAYRYENGKLVIHDRDYVYPPDYPFVEDGLLRSPWVDYELSRAGTDMQSALEELYGLQAEHGRKWFRASTLDIVEASNRRPDRWGAIDNINGTPTFYPGEGPVQIWGDIGEGKSGPFAMGCDLGHGQMAAHSTIEVIDLSTGDQCLEVAVKDVGIVAFAGMAFNVARWLCGHKGDGHCYMTFENNGSLGNSFGEEITRLGYGNVDTHKRKSKSTARDKEPTYLGMRNNDGGAVILNEMERAVRDGQLSIRSAAIRGELPEFDRGDDGKPEYPLNLESHGDRTQGLAMAWWLGRNRLVERKKELKEAAYAEIMDVVQKTARWSDRWRTSRHTSI